MKLYSYKMIRLEPEGESLALWHEVSKQDDKAFTDFLKTNHNLTALDTFVRLGNEAYVVGLRGRERFRFDIDITYLGHVECSETTT